MARRYPYIARFTQGAQFFALTFHAESKAAATQHADANAKRYGLTVTHVQRMYTPTWYEGRFVSNGRPVHLVPVSPQKKQQAPDQVFRVSWNYIEWAHGPGAESEGEGYDVARELCALPINKRDQVEIPYSRPYLIEEVRSVAELYVCGRKEEVDLRAARVFKRATEVLRTLKYGKFA